MTTTKTSKTTQQNLLNIAKKHSWEIDNRGDLETRMSDADDFIEVSVWGLKAMLEAAYKLGTETK